MTSCMALQGIGWPYSSHDMNNILIWTIFILTIPWEWKTCFVLFFYISSSLILDYISSICWRSSVGALDITLKMHYAVLLRKCCGSSFTKPAVHLPTADTEVIGMGASIERLHHLWYVLKNTHHDQTSGSWWFNFKHANVILFAMNSNQFNSNVFISQRYMLRIFI